MGMKRSDTEENSEEEELPPPRGGSEHGEGFSKP